MNQDVEKILSGMTDFMAAELEKNGVVKEEDMKKKLREMIFEGEDPVDMTPFQQ